MGQVATTKNQWQVATTKKVWGKLPPVKKCGAHLWKPVEGGRSLSQGWFSCLLTIMIKMMIEMMMMITIVIMMMKDLDNDRRRSNMRRHLKRHSGEKCE